MKPEETKKHHEEEHKGYRIKVDAEKKPQGWRASYSTDPVINSIHAVVIMKWYSPYTSADEAIETALSDAKKRIDDHIGHNPTKAHA